jgi:ABC-type transport system involved in multi-copper enzyme maturation permease subunit
MNEMSVASLNAAGIERRRTPRPMTRLTGLTTAMVGAEFLKIRRRRGLVALSAILTVGVVVVAYAVMAIFHAAKPTGYGPAGGIANLSGVMGALAMLGSVAAIIVGATAGAGDLQAGVFRDLVASGRSRGSLFAARIPGGLALLWPLVVGAWVIACAGSLMFADGLATPSLGTMIAGGAWVLLATTSSYLLALGIASITGSRTSAVAQVFAWQFIVSNLLLQLTALGAWRKLLDLAALTRLMPAALRGEGLDPVSASMSVGAAALVVAAWAVVPLALGARRTMRRDA